MDRVNAGQLRERLTILTVSSSSQDAFGAPVESTQTFAEVWGRVRALSGQERLVAAQVTPEATHEIVIRYMPGITARMRITQAATDAYDETARSYEIIAPPEDIDGKHRYLRLVVREYP